MKKIFTLITSMVLMSSMFIFTACQYDDTLLDDRLTAVENQVKDLQQKVEVMNAAIQQNAGLIAELQKEVRITDFKDLPDGFEVTFSNGKHYEILNGEKGLDGNNGKDGQDGHSPVISVIEENGEYYWAIDGKAVLDKEGNKISATAHISTPQVRINEANNRMEISFDNGGTWKDMGPAGEVSIIQKAEDKGNEVVFTLADGKKIVIPKAPKQDFYIEIASTIVNIKANQTQKISFKVIGADATTKVRTYGTNGFKAVLGQLADSYELSVTAPATLDGEVFIVAAKENGENRVCILTFEETEAGVFEVQIEIDPDFQAHILDAAAGTLTIPVRTNVGCKVDFGPAGHPDWFRPAPQTKAVVTENLVFEYDENPATDESGIRVVEFSVMSEDGAYNEHLTIAQWFGEKKPVTGGGKADLETINGGVFDESNARDYTTKKGWTAYFCETQDNYPSDGFTWIPDAQVAPVLSTNKDLSGTPLDQIKSKVMSPELDGGLGNIQFSYARRFIGAGSGVKFHVDILSADGKTVLDSQIVENTTCKHAEKVDFVSKDFNIAGKFKILIYAEQFDSVGNKMIIHDLSWTGYSK